MARAWHRFKSRLFSKPDESESERVDLKELWSESASDRLAKVQSKCLFVL